MGAALLGAVAPDFDMIWFHLIDHGAIHHHKYWVHAPGFCAIVAILTLPLIGALRPRLLRPALIFLAAITLHLILDSLGGGIMWLWPASDHLFELVTVPATQSHWVWSFVLHWTFLAELVITGAASHLFLRLPKD